MVGDGASVGDSAIVVGAADDPIEIADGTVVPEDAVITTQAQADALPRGGRGSEGDTRVAPTR